MVKKIIIIVFLLCISSFMQSQTVDSLKCEDYFKYFENIFSNYLVNLWEKSQKLLGESQIFLEQMKKNLQQVSYTGYVLVTLIINEEGLPCCHKLQSSISLNKLLENELISEVYKLRFMPAIKNNNIPTVSIYSFKLQPKGCLKVSSD